MSKSLFLDPNTWNLAVDIDGNIARCSPPYSIAQDVSCAVRTFKPEVYFDQAYGIPYTAEILGKRPPLQLVKKRYEDLAKTVTGVADARCTLTGVKHRVLTGYITLTTTDGGNLDIGF
jgi:hypothetical protein